MAQFGSIFGHIALIMIMALFYISATMAQDSTAAPLPAMDAGAGFSLPVCWALVVSSVVGSLVAFVLH
ncbi:hypothetical protein CISIN_1g035347mg [Citrus sinensis]|uniref:Uncharacterized protein n=1 Tax=Citrus sinensis TaxID=2711 RepID=A0A067D1H5_CITSI|nr:hypothetical protein CISIN_1g035347mg [Citrus sinensis]